MNPRSTCLWAVVAAGLCAFIFLFERHLHKPPQGPPRVLPALRAAAVDSIQILPKGQPEIRAARTNGLWELTQPFAYPARAARVNALLSALEQLAPATPPITAQELRNLRQADRQYGFEPPQSTIVLQQGDEQTFLHVGYKTGPGDQLFLQVVGVAEVYVVDADLLKLIPGNADAWRETELANLQLSAFDRLLVTNAGKVFELQRQSTNRLWRMILPGWEPRADSGKVEEALQQLQSLQVAQFISDDPKVDLDAFGLQTPDLSLTFDAGTNTLLLLEFGKSPTNNPNLVYARRGDQNTVVTVSKDLLAPWRAGYEGFRDRHLVTLTAPLDLIEVQAQDHFTLQRDTNQTWQVLPSGYAADPELVGDFITNLSNLQVSGFPKDVVTAPDLPTWGLDAPARRYILQTTVTNAESGPTNVVVAELDFGTNQEDQVFARRTDESSVYTVKLADLQRLPSASWQLRERRLWNFTEDDVARIVVQDQGRTWEVLRNGPKSWSLAPGSQGMLHDLAMEEMAHRLGELGAAYWVEEGDANPARYGFNSDDYRLTVVLRDGRQLKVEIGGTAPSGYPFATVDLDGRPWVFEFPWALYQFVQLYLTPPPSPR